MILDEIFETKEELFEKYKINVEDYGLVINSKKIPLQVFLTMLECNTTRINMHDYKECLNISISENNYIFVHYMHKGFEVKPFKALQWIETYMEYESWHPKQFLTELSPN